MTEFVDPRILTEALCGEWCGSLGVAPCPRCGKPWLAIRPTSSGRAIFNCFGPGSSCEEQPEALLSAVDIALGEAGFVRDSVEMVEIVVD